MELTGIRKEVFLDRYALKDKEGNPIEKNPEEMWKRIARAVSQIEKEKNRKKYEKLFYFAMEDFKYVPGGRILAGAGSGYSVTFYNCFVIPSPHDSRTGILKTLGEMVEIMAHGGGVGINLSSLRPRGSRVKKVNGFSSGPINWAELFSITTKDIIQQGGSRRGALMLTLWDWHPDIEEFISAKQDLSKINGANLSVCISDSFMKAVEDDLDWELVFPDLEDPDYDTLWDGDINAWKKRGKKVIVYKTLKARSIWNLIAESAWKSAEPGVIFLERYNKLYNNYYWNKIICTNPCGEEGLPAWGVCNLGSINLSAFVKGSNIDRKGTFDFELLKKVVRIAVRFQDDVIDLDPHIFEGIKKTQLEGERRVGLGTMGLADALIKMHIRYGSKESLKIIEKIYKTICVEAYKASIELAREKGPFPMFDRKLYPKGKFIQTLPISVQKKISKYGVRNSLLLMQAPTGTTSILAGTTSGIEPVFEFEFVRHSKIGDHIIRHPLFDKWYKKHEKEIKEKKIKKPEWFVCANDLSPKEHVLVQATIQKYVDASISKTVNAPKNHTVEDVKNLYMFAYKSGCKGITYMREGSRQGVLERKNKETEKENKIPSYTVKPRPIVVHGSTYKIQTPVGTAFITINTNGGNEPLEVFINVGKAGSDLAAMAEGLGRMISLAMRFSSHLPPIVRVREIIDQLANIGSSRAFGFGKDRVRSLPDAVAKVLSIHYGFAKKEENTKNTNGGLNQENNETEYIEDYEPESLVKATQESLISFVFSQKNHNHFDICPSCGGASFVYEEGCKKCYGCGYSEC